MAGLKIPGDPMQQGTKRDVAVQLVTYNNEQTLEVCLASLRRQRYTRYELIVVDNNSTDATRAILTKHRIQYIANNANIGYAAGHNIALGLSQSEYVLTLNPDVALGPAFLETLVARMRGAKALGSASGLLYRVNTMHERSQVVDSAGLFITPDRRQRLRLSATSPLTVREQKVFGPDGAAAFYRRAMLEDINFGNGVFDEDFFMHKEDVDICWRAKLRGWESVVVPEATAYHIRTFRAGHRKNIDRRMRMLAVRNRYYLMIKNELLPLFVRDCFWIIAYDIGIFLYVLFFERSSLPAYTMVIRALPSLLMKRSLIQKNRRAGSKEMAQWFQWRER